MTREELDTQNNRVSQAKSIVQQIAMMDKALKTINDEQPKLVLEIQQERLSINTVCGNSFNTVSHYIENAGTRFRELLIAEMETTKRTLEQRLSEL